MVLTFVSPLLLVLLNALFLEDELGFFLAFCVGRIVETEKDCGD